MARTVDVGIMSCIGLVFDMRRRDGYTALSLFGGFVDCSILEEIRKSFFRLTFRYGSCESSLSIV